MPVGPRSHAACCSTCVWTNDNIHLAPLPTVPTNHHLLTLLHHDHHHDHHDEQSIAFDKGCATLPCATCCWVWVDDSMASSSSSSSSPLLLLLPLSPSLTPAGTPPTVGTTANTGTSPLAPTPPPMTDLIHRPGIEARKARNPARSQSPASTLPRSGTTSPVNGDLHRLQSRSPKSIQAQSFPFGAVVPEATSPPTSSSGTYYSASDRYSSSTRNSVWTTRSTATVSTQYSVDDVPPVPKTTQGLEIVTDSCQRSPTSEATLQQPHSLSPTQAPRTPSAPPKPHRPTSRPDLTPIRTRSTGKVELEGQLVNTVALTLAATANHGPIQHLRIPGTKGSRLYEFLKTVLPTMSEHLLTLDLANCNLSHLPSELQMCTRLRQLVVSANPLGNPPPWLGHLTKLHTLVWDRTGASTMPTELAQLRYLTTLNVAQNQLSVPPTWLYRLLQLHTLHLEGNPFSEPWNEMLLPVIQSAPQSHQPSRVSISTRSSHPSSSNASLYPSSPPTPNEPAGTHGATLHLPATPHKSRPKSPLPSPRKASLASVASGASGASGSSKGQPVHRDSISRRWTAKLKRTSGRTLGMESTGSEEGTEQLSLGSPSSTSASEDPWSMSRTLSRTRVVSVPVYDPVRECNEPNADELHSALDQLSTTSGKDGPVDDHKTKVQTLLSYLRDLEHLCPPQPV